MYSSFYKTKFARNVRKYQFWGVFFSIKRDEKEDSPFCSFTPGGLNLLT